MPGTALIIFPATVSGRNKEGSEWEERKLARIWLFWTLWLLISMPRYCSNSLHRILTKDLSMLRNVFLDGSWTWMSPWNWRSLVSSITNSLYLLFTTSFLVSVEGCTSDVYTEYIKIVRLTYVSYILKMYTMLTNNKQTSPILFSRIRIKDNVHYHAIVYTCMHLHTHTHSNTCTHTKACVHVLYMHTHTQIYICTVRHTRITHAQT